MGSPILLLEETASLTGYICFFFFILPVCSLIGSFFLIAAIGLINKGIGLGKKRYEAIPVPSLMGGMGIMMIAALVDLAIKYALINLMGGEGIQPGMSRVEIQLAFEDALQLNLMVLLTTIFVNSMVFAMMLPTSFLRAMGVMFLQGVIVFLNVLLVVAVVFGITFVLRAV